MKYDSVPILEIALNIQVNTDETCSRMVQTVLEVLLFQRSQIPFCYNVFKSIVRKISGHTRESDQLTEWSNYRLTKQRATVQEAAETIELLFKQLSEAVQKSKAGLQFMILFGSTVFTAKEAFLINVPEVNKHHYPQYHRHSMETILKQVAMKITVAEELHDKPKVTGPTNTFLLMGLNSDSSAQLLSEEHENWQLINEYKLPVNCKQYVINLSNQTGNNTRLHCCKEMEVFNDQLKDLGIAKQSRECLDLESGAPERPEIQTSNVWLQIGNCVKGLKTELIQGKPIW